MTFIYCPLFIETYESEEGSTDINICRQSGEHCTLKLNDGCEECENTILL